MVLLNQRLPKKYQKETNKFKIEIDAAKAYDDYLIERDQYVIFQTKLNFPQQQLAEKAVCGCFPFGFGFGNFVVFFFGWM